MRTGNGSYVRRAVAEAPSQIDHRRPRLHSIRSEEPVGGRELFLRREVGAIAEEQDAPRQERCASRRVPRQGEDFDLRGAEVERLAVLQHVGYVNPGWMGRAEGAS